MPFQRVTREIVIGKHELDRLIARVGQAAEADTYDMLDAIGQVLEDSARRRITDTKRTPGGERWKPWSKAYAKTRGAGKSLGRDRGHLLDSLTHQVDGKETVEVGATMVYAAAFQHGLDYQRVSDQAHVKMPGRAFLDSEPGFSDPHDREEIRDIVREYLSEALS